MTHFFRRDQNQKKKPHLKHITIFLCGEKSIDFFYYSVMDIVVAIAVLSQFPFYYYVWNWPQSWVDLCGKERDPSKIMAYIGHFLKLLQIISLISVSSFHWPPFYFWPLFAFGQFLNFRFFSYSFHFKFCTFLFLGMVGVYGSNNDVFFLPQRYSCICDWLLKKCLTLIC